MKIYYAYTRVSTVRQGEFGVSLQQQQEAIKYYAQRCSLTIEQWFEERETAARRGRPIFTRMLKMLRDKQAAGVIIHKIDRSARNLRDWSDLGELIDSGLEVHFANESLDLASRSGRLSADIQAVVAADYVRNLREETKKGFYGRLKQGLFPMPAPVGYLNAGKGKVKPIDPAKAPLVRTAFELYSTGRYSLERLVTAMYESGLRNRKGERITRNGMSLLINNPFYFGLIRIKKTGDTFYGAHQPLISKVLFNRVQDVRHGKHRLRNSRHDLLFRRFLTCAICHHHLLGEVHKGHVYYRCQTRGCPVRSVRQEQVEKHTNQILHSIRPAPALLRYFHKNVGKLTAEWQNEKQQKSSAIQASLNKIDERLNKLTDVFLDNLIDKESFGQRKTALLNERRSLEDQWMNLSAERGSAVAGIAYFLELAKSAYLQYKKGSNNEKRVLLEKVISNRTFDGKNILFKPKYPFDLLSFCSECPDGSPHQGHYRTCFEELLAAAKVNREQQDSCQVARSMYKFG